ncbi:hypothetical protein LJC42_05645 [Eubacteriales bacterium OttesenSCG-928-K08]|nr:hypothetical protein [Eubacteriales bacterium OttesenSCG-928-K08]
MDWLTEVQNRIKRKNHVLFAKDSDFLADIVALIAQQNHRTMVLWAFEFADETVRRLSARYPNETRLQTAVTTSRDWAAGKVKMHVAQRAILDAHAVAKEISSPEDIALCHAIGQACGVVHANGHALGFPIYELTAIIRRYGIPECKVPVEMRKQQYIEKILYWRGHYKEHSGDWAAFMLTD